MDTKVNVHDLYLELKGRKKVKKEIGNFDKALFSLGINYDKKDSTEKKSPKKEKI